jgi:hypothetical protein
MKKTSILVACVLVTAMAGADAREGAIKVRFDQLVRRPEKYSGKRVDTIAYVVTSCTHCGEFFASVEAARESRRRPFRFQYWAAIGKLSSASLMEKWPRDRLSRPGIPNDGFVRVVGTFRYNKPQKDWEEPVPGDPNVRIRHVHISGFGWMGMDDKTITDITRYDPIGPNIPSGIN